MSTFPGPGTFYSELGIYDRSNELDLEHPNDLPLVSYLSIEDLMLYWLTEGLHVNVFVKSYFLPKPNDDFLLESCVFIVYW